LYAVVFGRRRAVAKIEAPLGYANVRAHALFHRDYLQKQQAAASQQAPPMAPPRAAEIIS